MHELIEVLRQETRYAVRSIRKTPLASGVVVGTLAVGIALITTFFSLINAAFYRPLPYPNADRYVALSWSYIGQRPVDALAQATKTLDRLTLFYESRANVVLPDGPIETAVNAVDSAFFGMFNVAPIMGTLPAAQTIHDRTPVAVINERFWQSRFGGRPDIIGQPIEVNGIRRQIVAVMPAWFTYKERAQVWIPLQRSADLDSREYFATGRLRSGATIEKLRQEELLVGQQLQQFNKTIYRSPRHSYLDTWEMVDRGSGRRGMNLMIALVIGCAIAVLLVACTNVASLMLARAARRRGELAVRAALGASRWQMIRQQLIESVLLAGLAGILGAILSQWGVQLMLALLPSGSREWIPGWTRFGLDWRVLLFAGAAALSTVLVFGLWPAREGTRLDLTSVLRSSADSGVAGRDPTRRLHLPVVLELTLSLALFVGATIALTSLYTIVNTDRGFVLDGGYRVRVAFDHARDTVDLDYTNYLVALRRDVAGTVPGGHVALTSGLRALRGDSTIGSSFVVPETRQTVSWEQLGRYPEMVSDNYFTTLGIRLLAGRGFGANDAAGGGLVTVVSQAFAQSAWKTDNVIGKTLQIPSVGKTATVIGVVGNVTNANRIVEGRLVPGKDVYFSERQAWTCCNRASFVVRSTLPASTISNAFQQAARRQGRSVPATVSTLTDDENRGNVAFTRMLSAIMATFATTGLVLAIMGIYGVVAFAVEQRTREIGIRIALGATSGDVIRHMMAGGMKLVAIGIALGCAAAIVEGRILMAVVLGTSGSMALSALMAATIFAGIAAVACYLPARRSATLDPLKALRSE